MWKSCLPLLSMYCLPAIYYLPALLYQFAWDEVKRSLSFHQFNGQRQIRKYVFSNCCHGTSRQSGKLVFQFDSGPTPELKSRNYFDSIFASTNQRKLLFGGPIKATTTCLKSCIVEAV